MAAILLPISFVFLFISLRLWPSQVDKPGEFIRALLLFSLLVLISTEGLSLFNLYSYKGLAAFWSVVDSLLLIFILVKFKKRKRRIFDFEPLLQIWNLNAAGKVFLIFMATMLTGIFIQGLMYPPNNHDSMTYHMARIVHWTMNGNVSHYPTSCLPQLYQPPFAEFFMGQLYILSGNDLWAYFVQFFYLFGTLVVMAYISRELRFTLFQKLFTIFLVVTIPEVILQASGTQNVVVVSFFIAAAVYYCIVCYKESLTINYIFLGISIGLAMLTKAIAYIYLAPALLVFTAAVLLKSIKNRDWKTGYRILLVVAAVILVNGGFFYRNYLLSGNLFGTTQVEYRTYLNKEFTPSTLASNFSRNVALHYGLPVLSTVAESAVKKFHALTGMNPDNPKTTPETVKIFTVNPWGTHEDFGANIIQVSLILIIILSLQFVLRKIDKNVLLYFMIVLSGFLLFCFYLKWQPWHSRLHTPFFILMAPVIAYFLANFLPRKISTFIILVIGVYALLVMTFNYSRPNISFPPYTADYRCTDTRFKRFFLNKYSGYEEYREIKGYLDTAGDKNIGLELGRDDREYPLFYDIFNHPVRVFHINVTNISSKTAQPPADVGCIISTMKRDTLVYNNLKYNNFTPHNTMLFLYKR